MRGIDIVNRARVVLQDMGSPQRWLDDEFVHWINDGCAFIAALRPDSCALNQTMALAPGTRQSVAGLTPPGLRVLEVVRVMGSGRAVRLVDRAELDANEPTWHAASPSEPTNWVYDNRDPKTFYVYPPALTGTQIELVYTREPLRLGGVADLNSTVLSLDDVYGDQLLNYVLYRCYGKDAEGAHNAQLATFYRTLAERQTAGKARADVAFSPDMNASAARPTPGSTAGGA